MNFFSLLNQNFGSRIVCPKGWFLQIRSHAGEIFIQMQSLSMKFKPAEGSWECPACMLNNKLTDDKCVACTASKPGSASSSTEVRGGVYFVVTIPLQQVQIMKWGILMYLPLHLSAAIFC